MTLSPDSRDRGVINTSAIPRDPVQAESHLPKFPAPTKKKKKKVLQRNWRAEYQEQVLGGTNS